MWAFLYKIASPKTFYRFAGQMHPWLTGLTVLLFAYGLLGALVLSPADYQQGDAYRIIYIHVPSAFLSLAIYSFMAFCALLFLVWRIKLADIMITVSAPLGACFTLLALITGSLWGKPMWGTWWIWDARLTSELILLFLYLGVIAVRSAFPDRNYAAKAVAVLVIMGFVDIPFIHYSVYWWNTLHQGATLSQFKKPTIAPAMLHPLLAMIAAYFCFFANAALSRARDVVLYREYGAKWVGDILQEGHS